MYKEIAAKIGSTLEDAFGVSTDVTLGPPADLTHGDLTTNVCMQLSKKLNLPPREIAETIVPELKNVSEIQGVEVAGPGFLNITLTTEAQLRLLIRTKDACTPQSPRLGEAPVIVEYSAPNIAKPLGVHHILSTVIGQAVANLHQHLGYNVIRINHVGDWGTQFGKLAVAMEKWGTDKPIKDCTIDELLDLYVRFHDEAEKDEGLEGEAREAFKKLEAGDETIRSFWSDVVAVSMQEIERLYERLHVHFDHTHGESFYEDKMQPVIDEGIAKKVFVPGKEGALIVEFEEESNIPPAIVVKADGATIYMTRDLATIKYRVDTFRPQKMMYVVDVAQQLYFQQLFKAVRLLGWEVPELDHVIFGRMSFPDGSMSTRKGNIVRLEDALNEAVQRADLLIAEKRSEVEGKEKEELAETIGVGAFVYSMLSQNRKQNLTFTWDKALTFEGNSGPYLQYTYARARSVMRKGNVEEGSKFDVRSSDIAHLEQQELMLMRLLTQFPDVTEQARAEALPHRLANYLYELCQSYNSFYNALPILDASEPQRTLRLALTQVTADVLKTGAELLTLRVPERM